MPSLSRLKLIAGRHLVQEQRLARDIDERLFAEGGLGHAGKG